MRHLLVALVLLAGCKKDEKGDASIAGKEEKGGRHECTITVAARPPAAEPTTGTGTAADEAAATEAAWADACGKLPPPEQPACRDSARYQAAVGVGKAKQVTVTVTLTPAPPPQVTGNAASGESEAAACQAALLDACEKAGGQGDCVAAGTHEKKGEIASSKAAP